MYGSALPACRRVRKLPVCRRSECRLMPHVAPCIPARRMPHDGCSDACRMLHVARCTLHVFCFMSHVACSMSHVACCMLHVECCHVAGQRGRHGVRHDDVAAKPRPGRLSTDHSGRPATVSELSARHALYIRAAHSATRAADSGCGVLPSMGWGLRYLEPDGKTLSVVGDAVPIYIFIGCACKEQHAAASAPGLLGPPRPHPRRD